MKTPVLSSHVGSWLAAAAIALVPMAALQTQPALAITESKRVVGEVAGSGFLFKDTLRVEAFDDPKVRASTDRAPHSHP